MGKMIGPEGHLACLLCILVIATGVSGCSDRPGADRPIVLSGTMGLGLQTAVLLPAGDYHLVTVRERDGNQVLCTEPSPDWAVAFGSAAGGSFTTNVAGRASAGASGTASTSEAITAMLGRTAGVAALRDGLYAACQAYSNKVIGRDAYALILSQYGNLLVALATNSSESAAAAKSPMPAGKGAAGGAPATADTSAQSAGSRVPEMQQQAVQALLVSCIAAEDPSQATGRQNDFLAQICPMVLHAFGGALPNLLRTPSEGKSPASAPAVSHASRRSSPRPL